MLTFPIHVRTMGGLEELLAAELRALGAAEVEVGPRIVRCLGDKRLLYRANLCCRLAIRVLKPLSRFSASNEKMLYDGLQAIDWSPYLGADGTLAIDPLVRSSFTSHSLYAAQLAKDAICDQFRERTGQRPSVDLDDPDLRLSLHLAENVATIYLDSSGESLHKRGYRSEAGEAPLNEVLAAGIVQLSGWDGRTPLVDPMCGSGTLVIEAALLARNIVPGAIRREYAYQWWPDYDADLHEELVRQARSVERPYMGGPLIGSDLDPRVVEVARRNAVAAGVARDVRFEHANFDSFTPPPPPGVMLMNPPYDERMPLAHAAAFYERIGDALKQRYSGYTALVLTGALEAAKRIGLKASRKIKLYNGPIECRLLRFELYAGSAKDKGQPTAEQPTAPQVARPKPPSPVTPPNKPVTERAPDPTDDSAEDEFSSDLVAPAASAPEDEVSTPVEEVGPTADSASLVQVDREPKPGESSSAHTPFSVPPKWQAQATDFANRLARMGKHWGKWARRQGITCYRIYDRDIPEIPLCLDLYEGQLVAAEFVRPHDRTPHEHAAWLDFMLETAAAALGIAAEQAWLRRRQRQRGLTQYERISRRAEKTIVHEGGHEFLVNLSDYLDTGLFLDHRLTRGMVEKEAAGKRVLNLFCYTGAFTVYAAAGGAIATTSVDLSNTYLQWAQENLRINGQLSDAHTLLRSDALEFLDTWARLREPPFELAVVDPPTFSNSKSTENIWDVQRDHVELLRRVLRLMARGGKIYFSTNFRRFKFHGEELPACTIAEISHKTVPPDFRNRRIHRCWTIVKG